MKKIELYLTQTCGFCHAAKRLLSDMDISYFEIDDSSGPRLKVEMMRKVHGMRSAPQIFMNNEHLGGFSELYAMRQSDKLEKLLKD